MRAITMHRLLHTCPFVSVIIPTYNRELVLCETLHNLMKQNYPQFEIIVVDQTSKHSIETEKELEILIKGNSIRYFQFQPPSLPGARNFGVHQAKGEIILFVDDDVIPDPQLISAHAAEYKDLRIGGVAGRRTHPASFGIHEETYPIGIIKPDSEAITNFSSDKRQESVQWASGCNMSFRKNLIEQTGGFETHFVGSAAYEEIDFSFRMRHLGYRIIFAPDAHLIHKMQTSGGCGNRRLDTQFYYGIIHNSLLFTFRNLPKRSWPLVLWHRFLMSLALAKQRRGLIFPLMFFQILVHSIISYSRSLQSLHGIFISTSGMKTSKI